MDLSKYLESMKKLPDRFSNLAFWRGVRKLRDEIVKTFEYIGEWGSDVESGLSGIRGDLSNTKSQLSDISVEVNGLKSDIDDVSIQIISTNLYNEELVLDGKVLLANGNLSDLSNFITIDNLSVESGRTLFFSVNPSQGYTERNATKVFRMFFKGSDGSLLDTAIEEVTSVEVPSNASMVIASFAKSSLQNGGFAINYDEIKPYEPYYSKRVPTDRERVENNEKNIDSYVKTSRNTDYTRLVKSCTHVKRIPLVTIIADDGWANDYIKLMDMVDKVHETYPDANIPCCISLQTNAVHLPNGMTLEQALYSQNELGWEYCCHVDGTNLANLATEEEIENKIVESLKLYKEYGIDAKNIVYCEGGNDERVRRISKKYFNCGATTLPWYGGADTTSDNTGVIGSFYLKRHGMGIYPSGDGTFENDYKVAVDNAIAHNGWLIFMLHPNAAAHDETQQGYFIDTVKYCIEQNVPIVTLQQGYEIFGNALECGDFLGSTSDHPDQGFAISKNGDFSKNPFA